MAGEPAKKEEISNLAERVAGKFLTFDLAEEEYGLEILRVREIIGMMAITPVPRTPDFVRGVINLRGKVIPVIDLRLKFGLPYKEPDERTCVIVVEVMSDGRTVQMGIVVDRVNEVVDVKPGEVEPTPSFGVALDTAFILGMAKVQGKVKILLDIDRVLTTSEVAALSSF
ncbi:MAG: chemotaxis protein CheW [Desulfarculus sp.]|jgi:purine-binding chemotaxis protein CheW|nr:chemotaxis protein CheW [Desulfarculus sp.]